MHDLRLIRDNPQAFDAALQKPLAVGTRAFDSLLARARASKANAGTKQSDTPNR